MNMLLVAAGGMALILGLVHSLLGEVLIFRPLARDAAVQQAGGFRTRHINILWASWHSVTVFGWGIAALLFWLAAHAMGSSERVLASGVVMVTLMAAGFVLFATRGRHPGWVGLAGIALLTTQAVM
jgi:hypothetical protein